MVAVAAVVTQQHRAICSRCTCHQEMSEIDMRQKCILKQVLVHSFDKITVRNTHLPTLDSSSSCTRERAVKQQAVKDFSFSRAGNLMILFK
jgi:hypothetical protein